MSHDPEFPVSTDTLWWERSLSRRDAHKLGLSLAALASLAGCSSDEVTELDALDAQRKGGWDVGDEAQRLVFDSPVYKDSKGSDEWKGYTEPRRALAASTPTNALLAGWQAPTLLQSLEQQTLASQLRPVSSTQTQESYHRARALGSVVTSVADPKETLLVVDVPGAHGPAAAAGLAEFAEPVFLYDNWPHPKGVVKSQDTLGSFLYYAGELEEKRAKRDATKAPPALILDAARLVATVDPDTQFDNRYFVSLPSADELKQLGIKRVVYVPLREQSDESDDLNESIVDYEKAGLVVTQVPLDSFQRDMMAEFKPEDPTRGYYYGGSHIHHTYFYSHYPMFLWLPMPSYGWGRSTTPPPRVRPPSYKPRARPTMFSSRTTGGGRGVGKSKPAGFGRISTRVDGTGRIVGTRSGSVGRYRSSSGFSG